MVKSTLLSTYSDSNCDAANTSTLVNNSVLEASSSCAYIIIT